MTDTSDIPLFSYLSKQFPDRFASKLIYHYTTGGMLETFFRDDADFHCTYYASLNDGREIVEGWDAVPTYLNEVCGVALGIVEGMRQGYYGVVKSSAPWLMSFTDQGDSLPQWGMYTDRSNGGYAFGFDWKAMRERMAEIKGTERQGRYDVFLSPCFYALDDIRNILDFYWGRLRQRELIDRVKSKDITVGDLVSLASKIHLLSSIIKQKSFVHEQEWRLVRMAADEGFASCEFIGGKPRIKAMLFDGKEHLLRNYIREIVVSPHGNSNVLAMNATIMCEKYGLDIPIVHSTSSYNGR